MYLTAPPPQAPDASPTQCSRVNGRSHLIERSKLTSPVPTEASLRRRFYKRHVRSERSIPLAPSALNLFSRRAAAVREYQRHFFSTGSTPSTTPDGGSLASAGPAGAAAANREGDAVTRRLRELRSERIERLEAYGSRVPASESRPGPRGNPTGRNGPFHLPCRPVGPGSSRVLTLGVRPGHEACESRVAEAKPLAVAARFTSHSAWFFVSAAAFVAPGFVSNPFAPDPTGRAERRQAHLFLCRAH